MTNIQYMAHIFAMLLGFYIHQMPHPDIRMVQALRYLADQAICSPMGEKNEEVNETITQILYGKPKDCEIEKR